MKANLANVRISQTKISVAKILQSCDAADMWTVSLLDGLRVYTEAIGFWAALLTTVAFAPQVIQAWRTGGEGLSWMMLLLFAMGVGLWFLYGVMRMSAPLMTANGLTGLQIVVLLGLKIRHAAVSPSRNRRA